MSSSWPSPGHVSRHLYRGAGPFSPWPKCQHLSFLFVGGLALLSAASDGYAVQVGQEGALAFRGNLAGRRHVVARPYHRRRRRAPSVPPRDRTLISRHVYSRICPFLHANSRRYSRIDRARGHKYAHVIVDKLGPSVIAPLQHKPIQCFDLEGQYSENRFPGGVA